MVHAYSLVHDDLPAMDNDDLRRGLPTCHKKFGEAMAILAGDALQALAFTVLSQHQDDRLSPTNKIHMIELLGQASDQHNDRSWPGCRCYSATVPLRQ